MDPKVTAAQMEEAQRMRNAGMSYRAIGAAFGVSGRAIQYRLNPDQAERRAAYHKEYVATHREELSVYAAEQNRSYREKHKTEMDLYQVAYRAEHKKQTREYRKNHRSEFAAYASSRRALKMGAMIGATASQLAEIKEIYRRAKDDGTVRCYLCGRLVPLGERHVDHIMPLSKGGKHRPSNLAIACATCNRVKNAKLPEEVGVLL